MGPKYPKSKTKATKNGSKLLNKSYGDVFLLSHISSELGLNNLLEDVFSSFHNEILSLSYYEIVQNRPYYLFPYWQEEHYLPNTNTLDSQYISKMLRYIGENGQAHYDFIEKWIKYVKSRETIYFDITSIYSYSSKISLIEWEYNRDKEALVDIPPQTDPITAESAPPLRSNWPHCY